MHKWVSNKLVFTRREWNRASLFSRPVFRGNRSVLKPLTGLAPRSESHQLTLAICCWTDTVCTRNWPWMIDYPLSALANQSLNWAWFGYRSLSLSMKGLASAVGSPSQWMAAFWARPCCGRAFVSLTDGFGLLNSFQEIITDLIWQRWWLPGPSSLSCQQRQLQRAGGITQTHWPPACITDPPQQLQFHGWNYFLQQMCPWARHLIILKLCGGALLALYVALWVQWTQFELIGALWHAVLSCWNQEIKTLRS